MVVGIRADAASAKRLADIGFVPGTRVEMVRRGSPCIVRVNGTGVGLGAAHQRSILLNREAISGIDTEPPAAGEPTASEGGAPREQRTGSHHG